jgi:hypothetical protein
VDIQHAMDLSEILRTHGVKVYPISGRTSEDECRRLMRLINEGAIDGLASAGKLTEGVDCPRVMSAQMCRPTKSQLLYTQMIGRVLRPFPAPEELAQMSAEGITPKWIKPHATVVDYVDVCGRHSLITTPRLFGLRAEFNPKGGDMMAQAEEIEALQEAHPSLDLHEEADLEAVKAKLEKLKTSLRTLDLLAPPRVPEALRKLSKFVWLQDGEGSYHIGLMNGDMLSARENTLGQFEIYRHSKGVRVQLNVAGDLKEAVAMAEKEIPSTDRKVMMSDAAWRKEPLTEKQAWKLHQLSGQIRQQFKSYTELYKFGRGRFESGDINYSRGSISEKIDSLMATPH